MKTVPDVLCLQEVWADADGDEDGGDHRRRAGLPAVEHHDRSGDPRSASRMRCSHAGRASAPDEALSAGDGSPGHRRFVAASGGLTLGASPSRRPSRPPLRRLPRHARHSLAAARLARTWRRPDHRPSVIIGADLNAVPDSAEVACLPAASRPSPGIVFSDTWEQSATARVGPGPRKPSRSDSAWPNRRIDYLLVSWPRPKPVGNPSPPPRRHRARRRRRRPGVGERSRRRRGRSRRRATPRPAGVTRPDRARRPQCKARRMTTAEQSATPHARRIR